MNLAVPFSIGAVTVLFPTVNVTLPLASLGTSTVIVAFSPYFIVGAVVFTSYPVTLGMSTDLFSSIGFLPSSV